MIGFALSPCHVQMPVGLPQPLTSFFRSGGGQNVAVAAGVGGGLALWTEVAPAYAACLILDNDNPATRLSWRETLIAELRNIYPVGEMVLSGSWSQLQSSGSGLGGSYTGNRAVSSSAATATASVTVDRATPYDVWVHYTGRTSGGYLRVDIDGAQDLVTEIDDPAGLGFRAFSTYAPNDLTRRQSVRVATGLTGSHVVTVSPGGTASPGGNAIMLEAIAITGDLTDPRIAPPLWQAQTAYGMGDEVQWNGIYYAARATGTSGTTAPSHTGGIASDGALDWRGDHRPTYPDFVAIDYASEREYALRFDVGGASTELGGQTHGNEVLNTRAILLDGQPWTAPTMGSALVAGQQVTVQEDMGWQTQSGTPLGDCTMTRVLTPGQMHHDVAMLASGPTAVVEWFYPGMVPMVHWDGESGSTVIETVTASGATDVVLSSHSGTTPPNVEFPAADRLGLTGTALDQPLRYGHEAGAVAAPGNVLGDVSAFLRPNLDGATASGSLDWPAKAYVQADLGGGLSFGSGDTLRFFSRHVMALG